MDTPPFGLSRRDLLHRLAGCAALLTIHDTLAARGGDEAGEPASAEQGDAPLIHEIALLTAVPLETMVEFYHGKIGFAVVEQDERHVVFAAGQTRLVFSKASADQGQPFYHFAFNIPHNKVMAAREWQLERCLLVPTPPDLRDPAFPDDVRHFRHWNAHSLFFFDPAFNIVEYIARHDLKNDAPDPGVFTVNDILYASEIGYVVEDPQAAARLLHERLGLTAYPNGTDTWWAMGDERGLLLCLPKGRVFGENTDTPKAFDVFPTHANVRGGTAQEFAFDNYPYTVSVP